MSDATSSLDAHQILAAVLTDAPEARETLTVLRPEVLAHTREAYDALYRSEQPLPAAVLHALAAVTADWQGSGPLAQWHRAQGADAQLTAADPVATDLRGPDGATLDAATLNALRDHVDLLSISPALTTRADQQRLLDAGVSSPIAVLISQLVSFESYLQRLVAGLAALHDLEVPSADAPVRLTHTHGRAAEHGGTTVTGRTRPSVFTREQLQWEPWVEVPAEDELTELQRDSFASKASTNSVYFRMLSQTPGITKARSALDNAIFLPRDGAPKAERELAAAVTSKVNDCIYCASVHARKSAGFSKRPEDVDALLAAALERDADWISAELAPLSAVQDERWSAVVTAAAELSRPRPLLTAEAIHALRRLELTEPQIADVLTAAAFFAWANRLMLSLGEPSLPDAEQAAA
ncbi:peroxidase-related enzyme [Brachybacterium tyrofermentans]|uniref:Peroxidase-related enzyme n=1 Tax=Brachybacterium tyrofermentans TaxID=47848 RepID=A0ABW0FIT1_9MICO|nr:peroxidase-related enzyme [Brachybacterium tyrofermentans]SLN02762.1 Alkylhydroperoxidase AhpD domain protein [Corynebacterium xerosis]